MLLKLKVNIYSLIIWFQECIILKQRLSLLVSTALFSGLFSACQFIIQRIVFDEWRPPCLSLGSRCPYHGHVVCAFAKYLLFWQYWHLFNFRTGRRKTTSVKSYRPGNCYYMVHFYLSHNSKHVVFITWFPSCSYLYLLNRFEDLMNNVPLPEYTRRDGSRNLVSR